MSAEETKYEEMEEAWDKLLVEEKKARLPNRTELLVREVDQAYTTEGAFRFYHWLWQHSGQDSDHQKFIELLESVQSIAKQANKLEPELLERIETAWRLIAHVSLSVHQKLEDSVILPGLIEYLNTKAAENTLTEPAKNLLAMLEHTQHIQIQSQLAAIDQLLQSLRNHSAQFDSAAEALQNLVAASKTFVQLYKTHMISEEHIIVPLLKYVVSDSWQEQMGLSIRTYMKASEHGAFLLLGMRHAVQTIPSENERFENTFPWFVRNVLLPIWTKTNSDWDHYLRVFDLSTLSQ